MKGCVISSTDRFLLQYILNDKEVEVKTELWMKQNAEYLKEQKGQEFFLRQETPQLSMSSLHLLHENNKAFYSTK